MSYFSANYGAFSYPLKDADAAGFRLAQLGAIHAAAAHFALRSEPGVVTMPTGSGKTAVLISAAFVLRAIRVLILAPGRLVREQIAEEVSTLTTLRNAGAIGENVPNPRVFSTQKRITTSEEWEALREFDVVVSTVQSISPEYEQIPEPPADLFDLVLVDEAHHSPARTWKAVLDHFHDARRLLFTATPFRQDQKEIRGRFIYTYDLHKAYEDGVFGEISYLPVTPTAGVGHDISIARAAERQFTTDRDAGLRHHLMVRTDSRKRAEELQTIYDENTALRLRIITGDKSLRYVKSLISKLLSGELDGVICVNMLGEGFNLPSLKIAAIHSPHRSLAVTLQFIGRFARTVGDNIGSATFLAIPSEIEIEAERLYDTRAVWQEMVQNLSATRVNQEAQAREVLESFAVDHLVSEDLADLSLFVLEPYYHVKVYQLDALIDLHEPVVFPEPLEVSYKGISETHNAAVYITREVSLPRWTTDDRLAVVQPDLFIFYQHADSGLLFICASRRSEGLYAHLSGTFAAFNPSPLPLVRLNRALNDLAAPEFFNVGMRNRVALNTMESYRIVTGSNADKAIHKSDGRLYHRGHVFGRASDDGDLVTIGLSSASKIWSNTSSKLPGLISWCEKLAGRISSDRNPVTGSGLDYLDVGEEITSLPDSIIAVDWPLSVYRNPPLVKFSGPTSEITAQLLDFDIAVDRNRSSPKAVMVTLRHDAGFAFDATFSFETDRYFEPASDHESVASVQQDRDDIPMIDFLNGDMPHFFTSDLSLVHGASLLKPPDGEVPLLDKNQMEVVDWAAAKVDIRREFGNAKPGKVSIHSWLEARLRAEDHVIVYYDHGTGEMADFVGIEQGDRGLTIRLYHCKGAGGGAAGHRLGDIYEVTSQAVKSVTWALKQRVLKHIRRRFTEKTGAHQFVKGDLNSLRLLIEEATPALIFFEFLAVQPGLQKEGLPEEFANILAAASDHLVRGGFLPLRIICSS
jgi:superfamily II DNA or RNA helicase